MGSAPHHRSGRLALVVAALSAAALAQDGGRPAPELVRFVRAVERIGPAYEARLASCAELLRAGRLPDATRALLELVPADQRTPAHDFLLGNLLYRLDPKLARELHAAAFDAEPDHPLVQLEWALELHRSGRHAEALALYDAFLAFAAGDARTLALRADRLLHLRRLDEALASWKQADALRRHTDVETAAHWVHGGIHPERRRFELIERAGADARSSALEELVLLDLAWATDWWSLGTNDAYLVHDLALAQRLLADDVVRFRRIELAVDVLRRRDRLDEVLRSADLAAQVRAADTWAVDIARLEPRLRGLGLIGDDLQLPHSSALARALHARLLDEGLVSVELLLARCEGELLARARSEGGDLAAGGDRAAVDALAELYRRAGRTEALTELHRLGWERYASGPSAAAWLASRGEALRADDPELARARELLPSDPDVAALYLACARRDGLALAEPLAGTIRAELTRLASVHAVLELFAELERVLASAGN